MKKNCLKGPMVWACVNIICRGNGNIDGEVLSIAGEVLSIGRTTHEAAVNAAKIHGVSLDQLIKEDVSFYKVTPIKVKLQKVVTVTVIGTES